MSQENLYEQDYLGWLEQQKQVLSTRNWENLDSEHLFEELEGMSRSEHRQLQNRLIQELSSELQESADFITNMTQKSVKQRTAIALLFLHETYEERPINISREDLANMVGTATETLIRLINQFKRDSILQVKARKMLVIDMEALQKEASI